MILKGLIISICTQLIHETYHFLFFLFCDKYCLFFIFYLQQSPTLRALYYVPMILSSLKHLMLQLHRRLGRAEAAAMTIMDMTKKKGCLVKSFD